MPHPSVAISISDARAFVRAVRADAQILDRRLIAGTVVGFFGAMLGAGGVLLGTAIALGGAAHGLLVTAGAVVVAVASARAFVRASDANDKLLLHLADLASAERLLGQPGARALLEGPTLVVTDGVRRAGVCRWPTDPPLPAARATAASRRRGPGA